ncbi:MAG TPA: hypothetical protein VGN42_10705 [Pirellulales bacterium]|jgi:hypothetical protein|nr:hypothetical protein [Pirellulales bacterium]
MSSTTIAYLGLLDGDEAYGDARGEEHLTRLAESVAAAYSEDCRIELISCGKSPRVELLRPGVWRRVLPLAGNPCTPWDACSWELPSALIDADIVHLHDAYSRTSELALLIAKQQRKAVCMTEYGVAANWLTIELELAKLADVVVCHSTEVARPLAGWKNVEFLPAEIELAWFGIPAEWPSPCFIPSTRPQGVEAPHIDYPSLGAELQAIYRQALVGLQEAAA